MDRRNFFKLGASGVALTMLPLGACSTATLPSVEATHGPTAVTASGMRFEARPDRHALVISRGGLVERRVGKVGTAIGQFNYPVGVAVAGELAYIVECGNHRIQIVDANGVSVGVIGEAELLYPGGIAITQDHEILVADSRNARVVGFTLEGDATRSFGEGVLSAPRGLALIGDSVLVADPGRRQVLELDGHGRIRRQLGAGWVLPYDVATDGTHVFVVDAAAAEIAVLDRDGRRVDALPLDRAPTFASLGSDNILYVS